MAGVPARRDPWQRTIARKTISHRARSGVDRTMTGSSVPALRAGGPGFDPPSPPAFRSSLLSDHTNRCKASPLFGRRPTIVMRSAMQLDTTTDLLLADPLAALMPTASSRARTLAVEEDEDEEFDDELGWDEDDEFEEEDEFGEEDEFEEFEDDDEGTEYYDDDDEDEDEEL